MSKVLVKQLLTSSNYWTLNKTVVKIFGIETAFLLTNLAEAETMMSGKEGWFYQTSDTLESMTTLSRYKQDRCIEDLEKAGILKKDVRGMPAKRYFKLDYKVLSNKIANNLQTSVKNNYKLDCEKLTTNKELNKELNNKEHTKEIVEQSSQSDKSDDIPYKEIVDYLNEKADRQFRHTTNKTKRLIKARVNEGFELEDFKKVIDVKVAEWKDNVKMNKYLKPDTLFSPKFEGYLNQPSVNKQKRSWGDWDFMHS